MPTQNVVTPAEPAGPVNLVRAFEEERIASWRWTTKTSKEMQVTEFVRLGTD